MKPPRSLTALAAAAAFLATASAADAASKTYCLDSPSCAGVGAPNLQTALTWAQNSPEPDRIEIGPGSYFPGPGSFTYSGSSTNTLTIVGAGTDKTHIVATSNAANVLVIDYADVSDLEIHGASPATQFPNRPAAIELKHGTASRLKLTDGVIGAVLDDGATLASSHVTGSGVAGSFGIESAGFKTAVVDTSVEAPQQGVFAGGTSGSTEIVRSHVTAPLGIYIGGGSTTHVTDSLIESPSPGPSAGIEFGGSPDLQGTITGTTIVEPSSQGIGVVANGAGGSAKYDVSIENTAIVAGWYSFVRQTDGGPSPGPVLVNVAHSAFDAAKMYDDGGKGALTLGDGNTGADPGFVNPAAHDYHLRPDSPLIDQGTATPAGGLGATDLAGAGRSLDGNGDGAALPDIGAFESPAVAPPDPKPPTGQTGDPKPPVVQGDLAPVLSPVTLTHKRFKVRKRATAFRFKLSEDAKVTIKIGNRKLVRTGRLGANSQTFAGRIGSHPLKRGRYVARVTARDAAGHASKTRAVSFRVL